MSGPLGLDDDTLAACVQCGLCLPQCPTWRATGEEARSPRGRIDLMRDVQWRSAPLDSGFAEAIDSCVGCRSCETSCPSGVRYGELLERTTATLATTRGPGRVPWWLRAALAMLDRPRIVRAGVLLAAAAQRIGGSRSATLGALPPLPLRQPRLRSSGSDVLLLTGCVMDATQRRIHAATLEVLSSAGFGVRVQPTPGCCGALAAHSGLSELARRQLEHLAAGLPETVPVISNSAGCGAAIMESGTRAGSSPAVRELAARTVDVSTFLLAHADLLPEPSSFPVEAAVLAQPCHLRNVQGADAAAAVPTLLAPYVELRESGDQDLCCGAGGSHSLLRPAEAAVMRANKVEALRASGAELVVSANPGCYMHLQAGGLRVSHPVEIIAGLLATDTVDPSSDRATTGAARQPQDQERSGIPGGRSGR